MDEENQEELLNAIFRISRVLGRTDCMDGSIAEQINKQAEATREVAAAIYRLAEAVEDK